MRSFEHTSQDKDKSKETLGEPEFLVDLRHSAGHLLHTLHHQGLLFHAAHEGSGRHCRKSLFPK